MPLRLTQVAPGVHRLDSVYTSSYLLEAGGRLPVLLQIELVILIAAVGAITGVNLGYLVGRRGDRALLETDGPLLKHRKGVLEKGEPFFARHGAKAVFLERWAAGLRIAAARLAGINRMHWPTFLFCGAFARETTSRGCPRTTTVDSQ